MTEHPSQEYTVGSIRYVLGSSKRNLARSSRYVRRELMDIFTERELNNAILSIALYDENDVRIRTVTVGGEPSEAMQKLMDYEFGTDDEVASTA